jgi:hypothetical protein
MKARPSRGETQRLEPQPRQSRDGRSWEGVFFLGADLENLAKGLRKNGLRDNLEGHLKKSV